MSKQNRNKPTRRRTIRREDPEYGATVGLWLTLPAGQAWIRDTIAQLIKSFEVEDVGGKTHIKTVEINNEGVVYEFDE